MRRRSWRRSLFWSGWLCIAVLVCAGAWIAITGLIARSDLTQARADLPKLRTALLSGDLTRARSLADHIRDQADSAHSLVSGPAWWVGANLPYVGAPLRTSRSIAEAVDSVGTNALPAVVKLADIVHGSSLRVGDSIDLSVLGQAQSVVDHAQRSTADALTQLRGSTASTWLGTVDRNRSALIDQLDKVGGDLSGANRTLRLALPMLGQDGTRRYFIGFENEAESRGLGGLPGAFAILTVDHGHFTFTRFGNDDTMKGARADVDLGADYNARYGSADPTGYFQNSDIGPDFRDAAQIWAGMWRNKTGQRIDGAIAVDPTALSYLLQATGPAHLADGTPVTGADVVALTQQTQYAKFSTTEQRKQYVVAVADAISKRITSGTGNANALIKAVSRAAHERRIVLWSSRAAEEANLIESGYSGALDPDGAPFTGFTVVNAAGSKLDYYLDRAMTYKRTGCGSGSVATATITLTNRAPRHGLPHYVTLRVDHPKYRTKPGDNYVIVTYYGSPGSRLTSAAVNGKSASFAAGREHGLTTASLGLELPVGRARTVALTLVESELSQTTQVLRQPAVRPVKTEISVSACQR